MQQNKQNLFVTFSNSIGSEHQTKEEQPKMVNKRSERRASTTTNLAMGKAISLDCSKLRELNPSLCKSFHMFKRCVSSQEIFYGKTSQEELFKMLHNYLTEVIQNPSQLQQNIKSMHFDQSSKNNKSLKLSGFVNSMKEDHSINLDRILSQENLVKSISIDESNGVKNASGFLLALDKHPNLPEPLSREISSIEEVESEIMEDSIKGNENDGIDSLKDIDISKAHERQSSIKFDLDISPKKQLPIQSPSIQIMIHHSSSGKISGVQKNQSGHTMKNSNTSFGFEFDEIKELDRNVLQQVSLLYVNDRTRQKESQISLSIRDSNGPESSWFSDCSSDGISLTEISEKLNLPLSPEFLEKLYFEPEPFLVTISLIYLLKYLYHSGSTLTVESASILLTTSLMVSYKIYEDLQINGLAQFLVDQALQHKLTKEELVRFERHYLDTMGYEVVITNEQFYKMLGIIKGKKA